MFGEKGFLVFFVRTFFLVEIGGSDSDDQPLLDEKHRTGIWDDPQLPHRPWHQPAT